MSRGSVIYYPVDKGNDPSSKDSWEVFLSYPHNWPSGFALTFTPKTLETAKKLERDGWLEAAIEPLEGRVDGIRYTKKRLHSHPPAGSPIRLFDTPDQLPDEALFYRRRELEVDALTVHVADKTVDVDASWRRYMTRRKSLHSEKTLVIPSGDVAFARNQTDLQKLLKHLLKHDNRVTPDFEIVGSERFLGQTVADILGAARDVDVALGNIKRRSPNPTVTLYHGTSKARWDVVKTKGLIPNKQGRTYVDLIPNYSDHNVYLAFDPSLAENYATRQADWDKSDAVVLEVKVTDITRLIADEDNFEAIYIPSRPYTLTLANGKGTWNWEEDNYVVTQNVMREHAQGIFVNDEEYQAYYNEIVTERVKHFLKTSLKQGTIAYKGAIRPDNIKLFMQYKRKTYPKDKTLDFETYQQIRKDVQEKAKRPLTDRKTTKR